MKKLSDDLDKLAGRAEKVKDTVKAAEQESKDKLEAAISKSKADAKTRQDEFKAQVKAKQTATAQKWEDLQNSHNEKVQQAKNKIEAVKEAHEAKRARHLADALAVDAEDLIRFAWMAIDDAELAVLEAIEADAYADSLAGQSKAA